MLSEPCGHILDAFGGGGPAVPSRRRRSSIDEPLEPPVLPFITMSTEQSPARIGDFSILEGGPLPPTPPTGADPDSVARASNSSISGSHFGSTIGGSDESQFKLSRLSLVADLNEFGAICRQDQVLRYFFCLY